MRYSIISPLLLIGLDLIAMERPEQKPMPQKEMSVISRDLAQEIYKKESYLSLLSNDLKQKLLQQLYPHLENFEKLHIAIASTKASSERHEHEKLLNDIEYNKKLIEQLGVDYHMSPTENALMLNTPASLKILVLLRNKKDIQIYDVHNYEELLERKYWKERVVQVIVDHLEYMIAHPSVQDVKQRANTAIHYVRRFVNNPFIKQNKVFDEHQGETMLPIVRAIDSIAHGFDEIKSRYTTEQYYGSGAYNNTVSQDYWDIAIRLKDPISPVWAGPRNPYIMRKTLAQAFKNKDASMVNIYLDVFLALPNNEKLIDRSNFEKWDKEYQLEGAKFKITYPEFLNDILSYVRSSQNLAVLNKLKVLLPSADLNPILNKRDLNITFMTGHD